MAPIGNLDKSTIHWCRAERAFRVWIALVAVGGVAGCAPAPKATKLRVGGIDSPVTTERLTGATLVSVNEGPVVQWTFTQTGFDVHAGEKELPAEIVETLRGTGVAGEQIEGTWRFDADKSELVLTRRIEGAEPNEFHVALPISGAGHVRVNLGSLQYNVLPLGPRR